MNATNVEFLLEFLTTNIEGEHAVTHRFLEEVGDESLELRLADGLTKNLLRSFSPDGLIADVLFNNERFPAVYMADWHVVHLIHQRAVASSVLLRHGTIPISKR